MESQYLIPYDWNVVSENNLIIHIWCHDRDSNRHLVRVEDYKATAYVVLPKIIGGRPMKWDRRLAAELYSTICDKKGAGNPAEYMLEYGESLYEFQTGCDPFLRLKFNSLKDMKSCAYSLNKGIKFERNFIKLDLVETDIDICRKLTTEHELSFCNWMRISGVHPKSIDSIKLDSNLNAKMYKDELGMLNYNSDDNLYVQKSKLPVEREWIVSHNDMEAVDPDICFDWVSYFRLLGVDAEQYSNNHRIFPEASNINHKAFMLSCVFQIEGDKDSRKRYCIVFGDTNDIPESKLKNSHVIKVNEEIDILNEFYKLTELEDPDILVGYNLDYDFPMLDTRLKIHNKPWPNISCLKEYNVKLDTSRWESSGCGHNEINKLDMPGRIAVDMYPVVKRGHKLLRYNLDTVAKHFLNKTKHDVSPVEMFLTFERNQEAVAKYMKYSLNLDLDVETVLDYRRKVDNLMKLSEVAIQTKVESYLEISLEERIDINSQSFDDYNDPSNSPIFDRLGNLNWCSNQLWQEICEVGKEFVAYEISKQNSDNLNSAVLGELAAARYIMTRVAIYCAIDSDLCIDLMEELNTCTDLRQMSDVTGITITDTFNRGQQVRVLSQLYNVSYHNKRCRIPKCTNLNCKDDMCMRTKCHDPVCENEHCRIYRCEEENCSVIECVKTKCHKKNCPCPHIFTENRRGTDYKPLIPRYKVFLTKRNTTSSKYGGGFVFDVIAGVYDGAMVLDFSSLYPSIMQEYNTCYTTIINPRDFYNFGDDISFTIKIPIPKTVEDIDILDEGDYMETEEGDEEYNYRKKEILKNVKDAFGDLVQDSENYYVKFVRPEIKRGILPYILNYLVRKRKEVRKIQANYKKGSFEWNKLESKQLSLKIVANSVYGFTGAGKTGKRPIPELAAAVTSQGQKLIKFVNQYAEEKYGAYIVYGDTDSSMIQLPSLNKTQYVEMGKKLAKEISDQFGEFLVLEFEKAMKGIFIKKKNYVGYTYKNDGTFDLDDNGLPKLLVRGIALARRDNSKWLLRIYEGLVRHILDDHNFYDTMTYLINEIKKLLSGDLDYNELVMVKGVGANYKNDKYFMKMFADNLRNSGMPVKAGERLGYIVTKASNPDQDKYVGNRMMLPKTYEELKYRGEEPELDYMYYLKNQSMNKLDPLLFAGFRRHIHKYQYIKCRPTTRHKNVNILTPLKMIAKMLFNSNYTSDERNIFLDKILTSIKAIDKGKYDEVPLCSNNEGNDYNIATKSEINLVIEDSEEYFMY